MTTRRLSMAAAIAAVLAGVSFMLIQLVHPPETPEAVTTGAWTAVAWLTFGFALAALVGITGIHLGVVGPSGWFGLVGAVASGVFLVLTAGFAMIEALVLPVVIDEAPKFSRAFLGLFGPEGPRGDLGTLDTLVPLAGALFLIGGVAFGVGLIRVGGIHRAAGVAMVAGALAPVVIGLIPALPIRLAAYPMGVALCWLGVAHLRALMRPEAVHRVAAPATATS